MKLSVLYTFFNDQELRIPVAIFKNFTFLATSQSQEQVQKIPLSPTYTWVPFLSSLHSSSVILIIKYSLIFQDFLLSRYNSRNRKVFAAF